MPHAKPAENEPHEQYLLELLDEERLDAEIAERCFRDFVEQAWHIVEPIAPFKGGWHIDAMCEHLEAQTRGQIRNLLINVPPRTSKSTLVSVLWPAWEWIRNPGQRYLTSSYALSLAIEHSVNMRRVVESEWYQARWSDRYKLAGDQNAKLKFDTDKRGYRITTAVDAGGTGRGGGRIVCDDPHNSRSAESATERQAVIDWWQLVMSTRGNDPKTVTRTVVMQRVHEGDLSSFVLKEGTYEHLMLPMEFEPARRSRTSLGFEDPRTTDGELLQPERFGPEEVASLKKQLGSYGAAGQLQQRPAPADGAMLERKWFNRRWKEPGAPDIEGLELRLLPKVFSGGIIIVVDCSFKETKDTDRVAMEVWGYHPPDRFLLDIKWDRMSFPTTVRTFVDLCNKWPQARTRLIEDKANGPAVIAVLKNKVSGLIPVEPLGSKEARVAAVSPEIEAGNVWLPANHPMVGDMVEEAAFFPRGTHDDFVDAMAYAILRLSPTGSHERLKRLVKW